jgi:tRNA A37 threonylcarbamoyladenosine dehydratase
MDIKQTYAALVKEAYTRRIPCKLTRTDTTITAQMGMDYDDELYERILDASEVVGMKVNELEVCAEQYGGMVLESTNIAGGPKNYRAYRYGNSAQLINILSRGRRF